jgi:hypothetical protein
MNVVTWLRAYLEEVQSGIEGINRNRMVIDKSQLNKYLNEHNSTQNAFLVGIVPKLSGKGSSADDFSFNTPTQLWVIEKTTYSENNYEQYFEIFERTGELMLKIVDKLLKDSASGCNNMRQLNVSSIDIDVVQNESACNGWKILFNFDVNL